MIAQGTTGTTPPAGDVQKAEVPAEPVVAQAGPYEFHVVKGQTYSWCTCGLSAKQVR